MSRRYELVVIGAGGAQAQAMLRALSRGGSTSGCLALDRSWRQGVREQTEAMGFETVESDALASNEALSGLLASTKLVANLAGPYYKTGATILDAAIRTGTHYLDISDDADVALPMLERNHAAEEAGVSALIGMGSSPGTTNILIRAAVDHLGEAEDVDINWTVDTSDLTEASIRHFWHCFNLVEPDGKIHDVPGWSDLDFKVVDFPAPIGRQKLLRLAHPEPITIPRFLPVKRASNYGGLSQEEALIISWSLANIADERRSKGEFTDEAVRLFRHYCERRKGAPRVGSGLIIDVHTNGNGLRFCAGSDGGMDDSTGIPAAAGAVLMMDGRVSRKGVFAPEVINAADFFESLRKVSPGGGGLTLYRLEGGKPENRMRIRDLLSSNENKAA